MNKKFIVLEGLDGSGKTSVGEALVKNHSYEFVKTPSAEYDYLSSYIAKQSHYVRLMYYYAGNFNMSDYISQLSNNVICNRYIYSTMACFSYFNNIPINETYEMMKLLNENIILPDLVIYLSVPKNILLERLKSRGTTVSYMDNYLLHNPDTVIEDTFLSLCEIMSKQIKYAVVDSSESIDKTCEKILNIISDI